MNSSDQNSETFAEILAQREAADKARYASLRDEYETGVRQGRYVIISSAYALSIGCNPTLVHQQEEALEAVFKKALRGPWWKFW